MLVAKNINVSTHVAAGVWLKGTVLFDNLIIGRLDLHLLFVLKIFKTRKYNAGLGKLSQSSKSK